MASDRARISYDEQRRWRGLVRQQGRVTLADDQNEADEIAAEEFRQETQEIVGPAGTPDDGFRVGPAPVAAQAYDFVVGPGTMYVGGVRAFSPTPISYSAQPDWLHPETDPLWSSPARPASDARRNELVYLLLIEQEVGAVEDTALREVALGGPDTCVRKRLLQRIVRFATDAADCDGAMADLERAWAARGLTFSDGEMRLMPRSRLQVVFPPQALQAEPCEPEAMGGYLQPDNQLIRVQIVADKGSDTGTSLVWGYDDASFEYRATWKSGTTLRLKSRPIDSFHRPRAQQIVEMRRSACQLMTGAHDGPSELSLDDYVASPTGVFATLARDYDPDSGEIVLATALPDEYRTDTTPIFVRVWEAMVPVVPPATLGATGMEVIVSGGPFHAGDFWRIAVRPATPTEVYPRRYLDQPQPPDGLRTWVCPLAVVTWSDRAMRVVEDCREVFDDLVTSTRRRASGCCSVTVRPSDLTAEVTLQSIIDRLPRRTPAAVCLMPGAYDLRAPLRLGPDRANLTIEACGGLAVLRAARGSEAAFLDGMFVLNRVDGVTLRGLRFEVPVVPFLRARGSIGGITDEALRRLMGPFIEQLGTSIGVRVLECSGLRVERCEFQLLGPSDVATLAAAIFANGKIAGLEILESRFQGVAGRPLGMRAGYLQTWSVVFGSKADPGLPEVPAQTTGAMLPTTLVDAMLRGNTFSDLSAAGLVYGVTGAVRIDDNDLRACEWGFVLAAPKYIALASLFDEVDHDAGSSEILQLLREQFTGFAGGTLVRVGATLARTYPLPKEFAGAGAEVRAATVNDQQARVQVEVFFRRMVQVFGSSLQGPAMVAPPVLAAAADPFAAVQQRLSLLERAAVVAGVGHDPGLVVSIQVVGNDADPPQAGNRLSCVWILSDEVDRPSSIALVGNRLHSSGAMPTVMVAMLATAAVEGNVLAATKGRSLVLLPLDRFNAVTGNVLEGRPVLPPRPPEIPPLPPPLNGWYVFNAVRL